jgi:hypothetical protein
MREYIETYRGYELKIRRFCLNEERMVYHRECRIYRSGEMVGISKTKKEAKDLIKSGYMNRR